MKGYPNPIPPTLGRRSLKSFWKQVRIGQPGECWLWLGACDKDGYGHVTIRGRKLRAHRFAYFLTTTRWPTLDLLHRCDNPPCCNLDHLFEGTKAENRADCVAKGRQAKRSNWNSKYPKRILRGESALNAVLTDDLVREIRRGRAAGESVSAIARRLNRTRACVSNVTTGRTWCHVR
jgi:hypothetical protein